MRAKIELPLEWHPNNLQPDQISRIADAYFICEKNPRKMGEFLGLPCSLSPEHLSHPLVRRSIVVAVVEMRRVRMYTREEHVTKLKEIRDMCLKEAQYKNGLAAEIAIGRAAGLYENIGANPNDLDKEDKPEQLTSDQIRARLAKLQGEKSLPAPASETVVEHPPQPTRNMGDAF